MANDKLTEFLHRVLQRTLDGEISWKETADEDTFLAEFHNGAVLIARKEHAMPDDVPVPIVRYLEATLLNKQGRIVEEFVPHEDDVDWMTDLYDRARLSARKGDSVIDELLKEV
ncbi:MAG: hypothetical protein B7Z73_11840 [Planctomycetia bacterium 21-64-5]|nr:MAG: hypothetical protein B7Z73_11840 [Planctomycetia bacterium 21-64-5]HQU44495.1 hypothetical protein [Pirellulales bacterium]